ncbi:MAG TPA: putative toxin-antitoxin system toxin component, PIN family [Flavisolibacter sp.]|nr:putative toxin-antitoxin system toxin component, PIN family [Flavisolibacter sp.]
MSDFFVFDTNSFITAALKPTSTNRRALDKAIVLGELAASSKTIEEFIEVLFRQKFDKYFINDNERWLIINKIESNTKIFTPSITIEDCRDPKDNKFLELAVAANASCIITGDADLLILHPFRGIPILNAVDFLNAFQER